MRIHISNTLCLALTLIFLSNCSNQPHSSESNESLEIKKVLKRAEEIAFKEYGSIIRKELPLRARLAGDSIWIVEGTLPKGAEGGTVYIELSRTSHQLLKITHYK
jgi:NTF2 fold immunity protein